MRVKDLRLGLWLRNIELGKTRVSGLWVHMPLGTELWEHRPLGT